MTASGLLGVTSAKVGVFYPPGTQQPASYTVRLYFAEPKENTKAGDRVFAVSCREKKVLADFDVVRTAGGPRRGIVKIQRYTCHGFSRC